MGFEDLFYSLQEWGFLDVLLPFILVFTIVFAALAKTKILGEGKKQFNVIVAMVMGASIIFPHITGAYVDWIGFDPVDVINSSLPQVSIILVAIIMVLLIIGVFGNEIDFAGTSLSGWIVLLAFICVALIFGSSSGWIDLPEWAYFLSDPEIQSLVVMILVFGLIIWFVTKDDSQMKADDKGFMHNYFGAGMQPRWPKK